MSTVHSFPVPRLTATSSRPRPIRTLTRRSAWVYVNENASPYNANPLSSEGASAEKPTKVIIAAQLVDEDGNALEFAEYGSTRTSVAGLKTLFANNCGLYRKRDRGRSVKRP